MERYLFQDERRINPGLLFDEMRIELVGTASFREHFGRIVREGGGKIVDRLFQGSAHNSATLRVDVVVAEEDRLSPNVIVETAARSQNVPLVSARWLIDSIQAGVIKEDAATMAHYKAQRSAE